MFLYKTKIKLLYKIQRLVKLVLTWFVQTFGHVGNDYLAILSPRSLHILPN